MSICILSLFQSRLLQRNLEDINTAFSNAVSDNSQQEAGKLDDHLQPIPFDVHGALVRSDADELKYYEQQGKFLFN